MKLIDGKKISEKVLDEIKFSVQNRVKNNLKIPHLAAILVGDNPASKTYVSAKERACSEIGFDSTIIHLSEDI